MKISLIGHSSTNMLDTPIFISDLQRAVVSDTFFFFFLSEVILSCHSQWSSASDWLSRTRSVSGRSFPHLKRTVCHGLDFTTGFILMGVAFQTDPGTLAIFQEMAWVGTGEHSAGTTDCLQC